MRFSQRSQLVGAGIAGFVLTLIVLFLLTRKDDPPRPIPAPPLQKPLQKKYAVLYCINWRLEGLNSLPLGEMSEFTYFVLPVTAEGSLSGTSDAVEGKFVADIHKAGGSATFSIGGGTQDVPAITKAVGEKHALVKSISSHIARHDYNGVTLNIENTGIQPMVMAEFIRALRRELDAQKPRLIIGCVVQPYQLTTVWSKLEEVIEDVNWVSPMLYDAGFYDRKQYTDRTNLWLSKVPKHKLLCGVAVNYPAKDGGLTVEQFGEMLDEVQAWGGVAIWQNTLYTKPYQEVRELKAPLHWLEVKGSH